MDLSTIPDDVLLARGKYSTLNQELRTIRADMQKIATHLQTGIGTLLKDGTSDIPQSAEYQIGLLRASLDTFEKLMWDARNITNQKILLRDIAYSK
jgi:hypothetical protein